ncbi:MAG: PAS domain-containing protein [Planctomycetaceae bacterium]|nr:PAS domain-containing protein [Planctomycetaceae bacterium]
MAKKKVRRADKPAPRASREAPAAAKEMELPPESRPLRVIVGVGASAGGLEAFSEVLRALPQGTGLALVLVQHLAPHHESSLASLLAPVARLPLVQLAEDTLVEPDHVYVIPPNRSLELRGMRLILHPRPLDRTQYTPIDGFFQSLARELGGDAVGVILSGTGSDGVDGVRAIKAAGGTVLVQDPESARQDGMPRAALASGCADLVLTPHDIADELVRLAGRRPLGVVPSPPPDDSLQLSSKYLERIFLLLRATSGIDFSQYKLPTVQRRIQRRLAMHKLRTADEYVRYLQNNPAEVQQLSHDILIHVTRFFREPESFDLLAKEVFPSLLEARQPEAPLRIWVPACSTGEEPYSVAMALVECLDQRGDDVPVQIFATDISEPAVEQARAGVYPPTAAEDLSEERLRRFFTKVDGSYRINKPVRDLCVFARQDLTRDPPFSKLDLILCRNVLIYLGQAVQNRLIRVFHFALKPTGFLVLGSAETIGPWTDLFSMADKKHRVYRRKQIETPADMHFSVPFARPAAGRDAHGGEDLRSGTSVQNEANRLVLDRYSPPGVIVNDDLRIIQFRGQTGRSLEPAPGDASLNLLKMCREGLLHGLRTAIQNAKQKDAAVRREGLRVKTNGDFVTATIEVIPLSSPGEGRHYLILFRDVVTPVPAPVLKVHRGRKPRKPDTDELQGDVQRLQKELIASREYLQSIIQDLEAANEELQSANEEILSSNEELQSTNEELDTAKEELQSTNEELNTLNEELHSRNDELARTNSDLINLLHGVQIAIVIVAGDLRIRRFTPMAERVLNLIPGDIGRPISHIKPNINCPDLEKLIGQVIDSVSVEQREVEDAQGRMFSLTIRPYENVDNRIDGALLVLLDVDEARRNENQAREARVYAEAVLAAIRHPLAVLDEQLRIRTVNSAFTELFRVQRETVEGRSLFELDGQAWQDADLRAALEQALTRGRDIEGFELRHEFRDVGPKRLRLSTRRVEGERALILLELQDIDLTAANSTTRAHN